MNITWTDIAWGAAITVVSAVLSLALVTFFVLRLPADYFLASYAPKPNPARSRVANWFARFGKNIIGGVLVVAGAIMAIPGVPGQGILTMFIGLMLVDFPGKRRMEMRLVRRPSVRNALNSLRARFRKPPLEVDP
ncbi:MAG: hypothetical protein HYY84_05720 [Deltaproteobacteria bacterium]|nr:hypothetical protein [Deltaproteobacteria bacterium]